MPDKKLTDNEIVKAFKCCADINDKCPECPLKDKNRESCVGILMSNALDLINRLQGENERLELELADTKRDLQIVCDNSISVKLPHCVLCEKGAILTKSLADYDELIADISAEARKEFAERLLSCYEGFDETNEIILFENLVKAIEDTKREL